MRIPSPRARRTLGLGLAALLAPALVTGCGSADDLHRATTSMEGVRTTAAAVPPREGAAATDTSASPSAGIPSQRTAPPSGGPAPRPAGATAPAAPTATATPTASPTPTAGPSTPPQQSRVIRTTAGGSRTVALTFDDGPGPATRPILDLLAQYHAHATFCLVGDEVRRDPGAVRRILAEGHRLCDHTVDHPQPLHALPHDRQVHEIADAEDAIVRAGGPGTRVAWFRAPGGDFTAENEQIAADHGMASLGWSVDPRDWARPGTPAIVADVERHLRPGGVVLMHDGGGDRSQTVAALRDLLPWLTAQGYTFAFPAEH
ncbi:polysaccharide deacetylase family protein [Kitasatospora sp. NBC_01539]|uniref:polysaccharide deacetylase family protein n=1 Tax=Kitasatospora sp. NBC_01539 TaxID=2903577 RepID=UPI0038602322